MALSDVVASSYAHVRDAYDELTSQGATIPSRRNVANLASTVMSLPSGGGSAPFDPDKPTLTSLAAAVKEGEYNIYPVGTVIPDKWGKFDNPLIVAHYLDATNNDIYKGAEGVFLVRKFATEYDEYFAESTRLAEYATSNVHNYLQTEYLGQCSAELQSVIGQIDIPYSAYGNRNPSHVSAYWFLMGLAEVFGIKTTTTLGVDGDYWAYWQQAARLYNNMTTPDMLAASFRSAAGIGDLEDELVNYWLRTEDTATDNSFYLVNTKGNITSKKYNVTNAILPACFISKRGKLDES